MKRIGLLGGSFDPVHRGHLSLAVDALEQAGLSSLILMPARRSPFKLDQGVTSAKDRLAMLQAAAEETDSRICVSTMEVDKDTVSYTYITLGAIKQQLSVDEKLYFITGTDTYLQLADWKNGEEVLKEYAFIVGKRPGYKDQRLVEKIREYSDNFGTETIVISNRQFDVSSTEIRQKAVRRESLFRLVPESVERYIYEHGLYGSAEGKSSSVD